MTAIAVIDHDAVLAAIDLPLAIASVRSAFVHYSNQQWTMPAKVYVDAPPHGDFRAMPACGGGLALVKWVTSFPGNPARGLPTVTGVVVVSDAENGEPLAIVDARAVTALRTGAVAAVATRAFARADARTVGIVGCGLHGTWVARSMAADGYGPGVCYDPHLASAQALAAELGWHVGGLAAIADCDVICTVTPGESPVLQSEHLRPGVHVNALGADSPLKAELTVEALLRCALSCDEWDQAAHGGEITRLVERGDVQRGDVTELGWVLTGADTPRDPTAITLFDSTGLAIQDLAICKLLVDGLRDGTLDAPTVEL